MKILAKTLVLTLAFTAWFSVCGCFESVTYAAVGKEELLNKVGEKTKEALGEVIYADFDGDGKKEVFVLTKENADGFIKELWFASEKEVKELVKGEFDIYGFMPAKISRKQTLVIAELGAGGSGSTSRVYKVNSGKAVRVAEDLHLEGMKHIKGRNFAIFPSAFDAEQYDSDDFTVGHTYKKYYLKWTGKTFTDYKVKKISKAEFMAYENGADTIKKIEALGYKIDIIYKRANGIININASKKEADLKSYDNVSLSLKNNKVEVLYNGYGDKGGNIIEYSSYGGIYESKSQR